MKKIVLTGGGTAGHVTPNMALIPELKKEGYEISYIGSYNGIEKSLIESMGIEYHGISSGKLRRYFDLKNFTDPFKINHGCGQAYRLLKKIDPDVVFSKGGFVSVPVVLAARRRKIPVIIHESDMTPGLANKLCIPSASKVCANFPETVKYLPSEKAVLTGTPIRKELYNGDPEAARQMCGFNTDKPVILIMGGSLGAAAVNEAVRGCLDRLLPKYNIIHLCGKGKLDEAFNNIEGYVQFEYIKEELKDLLALSDLLISRAGANAICEILALAKPNLLIPLPAASSRGDQILNAASFEKQGFSIVLKEEELNSDILIEKLDLLYNNRDEYINRMKDNPAKDSTAIILGLINDAVRSRS